MLFQLKNPPIAFGLDLTDQSAKIAQLTKSGRNFNVELIENLTLPPGLIASGEIQNLDELSKELNKLFFPYRKQLVEGVIASLPESKSFIQTLVIPKDENLSLSALLDKNLSEYLPLPLEDMYYDSAVTSETDKDWQVVIGAAPKTVIDSYISLLEALGLLPVALDIQAMALTRAVLPIDESSQHSRAIIDITRRRASLIVHDQNAIQFTVDLPISGDGISEAISRELDISIEQAESAKILCGLDPSKCEGVLRIVLEEVVENLVKKISEARDFYQDHFVNARDFEEILLTGGGAYLACLDQVLSKVLKVPVELGEPWKNMRIAAPPKLTAPSRFAAVIGLAARGAVGEPII